MVSHDRDFLAIDAEWRAEGKVHVIAEMYIYANATIEQVMAQYDLSAAEVHAAIAYYDDHQSQFEAEERALQALIDQARVSSETRLVQLRARAEEIGRNKAIES